MIDINSTRIVGVDPDAPDDTDAIEQARADYLQDWCNGDVVDREAYTGPLLQLADESCLTELVAAERDDELLDAARAMRETLMALVVGQVDLTDDE